MACQFALLFSPFGKAVDMISLVQGAGLSMGSRAARRLREVQGQHRDSQLCAS